MNIFNEFFENDDKNSYDINEDLELKIIQSKELVESGNTISSIETIEETIQICLETENVEDGLFLTEAVLEIAPYNSEFWQYKGIFLNNLFEFEEAYYCFVKSLTLNPGDVETLIHKAVTEENLGFAEDATITLNKALEIEPSNEEALFNMGVLFERQENYKDAIFYLEKAVQLDENYTEALYELGYCYENNNNLSKSLEIYDRFLDLEPYSATGWYNRGIVLIRQEKHEKAINSFELSIAINDSFPSSWFNLGIAYANSGSIKEALNCFNKARELDPKDETISFNIGQSYEDLGNINLAIKNYSFAIKENKFYVEAYLARGFCYIITGRTEKAMKDLSTAITLTGTENDGFLLENNDFSEFVGERVSILSSFKSVLNNYENIEMVVEMAKVYLQIGEYESALKLLIAAESVEPENANIFYIKSKIFFHRKNALEAIECLKHAMKIDPNIKREFARDYPEVKSSKLFIKLLEDSI